MRLWTVAVALLIFPGAVSAQRSGGTFGAPSASHSHVPPLDDADPAEFFAERIKQFKRRSDLAGMLKQVNGPGGFDFERIRQLLEANPHLLDQAREILKGVDLDDPQYAGLAENIRRLNNWNVDPAVVKQLLQNFQQGSNAGGPAALLLPKPTRPQPRGTASLTVVDDDAEALRQKWARNIAEWASRFPKDKLNGTLRDSPALKKLFEEIAGAASRSNGGEGLDKQLARWQLRWEAVREWLPKNLPGLNLSELSAPDVRLPNLSLGGRGSGGARSVLGTAADLLPVLYVAIGVIVLLVIVRTLRSRQQAFDPVLAALGPWPVAPGRVENRRQLIRAFDYLAQIRCGVQAKSWHHRAVAQRLPRDDAEREAAQALAALYEWARYSPQEGEPSAQDLEAARRRLKQLAEDAA
jgi:hypothetical protein